MGHSRRFGPRLTMSAITLNATVPATRHNGREGPKARFRNAEKLPAIKRKAAHARRGIPYRGERRQAAKRAAADIEGHSTAATFGEP
jgi:hypothetical protein